MKKKRTHSHLRLMTSQASEKRKRQEALLDGMTLLASGAGIGVLLLRLFLG